MSSYVVKSQIHNQLDPLVGVGSAAAAGVYRAARRHRLSRGTTGWPSFQLTWTQLPAHRSQSSGAVDLWTKLQCRMGLGVLPVPRLNHDLRLAPPTIGGNLVDLPR